MGYQSNVVRQSLAVSLHSICKAQIDQNALNPTMNHILADFLRPI